MKILHKFYIGLVSAWKMFCAKVCAHGKLQVKWVNSIRGAFKTEVIGNGSITIGRFLMSRGPLYLKSVNDGKLTIGDDVFFNHNCSITCAEKVSERWHVVYLVPAIIGFVMSLFALLFARETNAFLTKRIEYLKTPIEEREQRSKEGREQNAQGGILTAVKFAFRHRQLRFLIIACCCFYLASLGTATYSTVMAKSALMTEEEITLALFLYPVGNALFTLISGFVSDKFGRKVTIVAMSCSALTCYLLFIFSGMFKWTPYLTGFAIGGFMGSYWGAGDTIGGIMFSESTPTNLRSSVTVINTLLNGVMGGLATVITMILLPIIPESMFGYMYLGLTVPGLVGAIVIMWLFVGETRGLDLKTVTGTEWDKPKKVKEE